MVNPESLDGLEFEALITDIFKNMGYISVHNRKSVADGGIDVEAINPNSNEKIAIQCKKRGNDKKISRATIQQIDSARRYENFDVGMVVTNTDFTKPARKLANDLNIKLISGNELQNMIENYKEKGTMKIIDKENGSQGPLIDEEDMKEDEREYKEEIMEIKASVDTKILTPIAKTCRYCRNTLLGTIQFCTKCEIPLASHDYADPKDFLVLPNDIEKRTCPNGCGTILREPDGYCSVHKWAFGLQ